MSGVGSFFLKIRRRETPFYDRLYRMGKSLRYLEMPVIRPLHRFLYGERMTRLTLWRGFMQTFYYNPLFKGCCQRVGKGLVIHDGLPQIFGALRIVLGENVVMHGTSSFVGAKVFEHPTLRVGDNTHLGSGLGVVVGRDITIGNNVMIANGVNIFSYDQHPADPARRHLPASPESSRSVVIEDNVWIGAKSIIFKGVTIGRNSIVAAGSVVTQKVPADSMVMGNPARVFPLMF